MTELSTYQDFDGFWCVQNQFGDQEYGGFRTEKEALDWIDQQQDQPA